MNTQIGVRDLPIKVRTKFIAALMAEAVGNAPLAEQKLNEGIELEKEEEKLNHYVCSK